MARSEDEEVMLGLLIVRLVEVVSGALVHVAATGVKNVVGLATALCYFPAARATAASDTDHLATLARILVGESVLRPSLLI